MDLQIGVVLQGAQSYCVQHHPDKWQFGLFIWTLQTASCFKLLKAQLDSLSARTVCNTK